MINAYTGTKYFVLFFGEGSPWGHVGMLARGPASARAMVEKDIAAEIAEIHLFKSTAVKPHIRNRHDNGRFRVKIGDDEE